MPPFRSRLIALFVPILLGCEGEPTSVGIGPGGKADDLDPGAVPALAASQGLVVESDLETCAKDLSDADRDGTTEECDGAGTSTYRTTVLARVEVAQSGVEVTLALRLCDIVLPPVGAATPSFDAAFLQGLPPVPVSGRLVGDPAGVALETSRGALLLGATLADLFQDALPATSDDARVIDQDVDGAPGVSLHVLGARVFIAMRAVISLRGVVAGAAVAGDAQIRVDQVVFGDTIPFFDAAAEARQEAAETLLVSERHAFRLTPLPSQRCEDLR